MPTATIGGGLATIRLLKVQASTFTQVILSLAILSQADLQLQRWLCTNNVASGPVVVST